MKIRVLSLLLSVALVTPQAWGQSQAIANLGAQLAENIYQTEQLAAQLEEAKIQFDRIEDLGALDTYRRTMTGVAITMTAATGYLGYKSWRAKDAGRFLYGFLATLPGAVGIGTGISAAGATIYSNKLTRETKEKLVDQIIRVQSDIRTMAAQSVSDLDRLRAIDPSLDAKIRQTLQSTKYQSERMMNLRRELGAARASLYTEKAETNLSLVLAGGSFYSLAKSTMKGDSGSIAADLASALIFGGWVKHNQEQQAELKAAITKIERSLTAVETEYRKQLVNSLSSL